MNRCCFSISIALQLFHVFRSHFVFHSFVISCFVIWLISRINLVIEMNDSNCLLNRCMIHGFRRRVLFSEIQKLPLRTFWKNSLMTEVSSNTLEDRFKFELWSNFFDDDHWNKTIFPPDPKLVNSIEPFGEKLHSSASFPGGLYLFFDWSHRITIHIHGHHCNTP